MRERTKGQTEAQISEAMGKFLKQHVGVEDECRKCLLNEGRLRTSDGLQKAPRERRYWSI